MRPDAPKGSIPLGEDIMQLARLGEIGAMQNLFAAKNLTANHRDEEGITPLHVCFPHCPRCEELVGNGLGHSADCKFSSGSGQRSTTNMQCASSC